MSLLPPEVWRSWIPHVYWILDDECLLSFELPSCEAASALDCCVMRQCVRVSLRWDIFEHIRLASAAEGMWAVLCPHDAQ